MPALDGHTCVVWRDHALFFGGKDIALSEFINYMWKLDLNRTVQPRMEIVPHAGSIPTPRAYHAATIMGKFMIVHGGVTLSNTGKDPSEVYFFDCDAYEWTLRRTLGEVPCNRSHHSIMNRGDTVFLYGGFPDAEMSAEGSFAQHQTRHVYDIYELSVSQCTWRRVQCTLAPPPMLWGHASILYNDNLLVYGGVDVVEGNESKIICVWHTERAQWRWVEINDCPKPRALHTAVLHNDAIIVFGGMCGVNQIQLNDLWAFSLDAGVWSEIQTQGGKPPPRSGHTSVVFQNKMYVLGGVDATDRTNSRLYVLDLGSMFWVHSDPVYEMPAKRPKLNITAPQPQMYSSVPPNLPAILGGNEYGGAYHPTSGAQSIAQIPSLVQQQTAAATSAYTGFPSAGYMLEERIAIQRHVQESIARAQNLQAITANTTEALNRHMRDVEVKLAHHESKSVYPVIKALNLQPVASTVLNPLSKDDSVYLPRPKPPVVIQDLNRDVSASMSNLGGRSVTTPNVPYDLRGAQYHKMP